MRPHPALHANLRKVEHARILVKEMRGGSFPHGNSSDALNELSKCFDALKQRISKAILTQFQVELTCRRAIQSLEKLLPVLGFVLRSTNTRNSFEFYGPLAFLAQKLSDHPINILISSEWDYSPYVYPSTISELEGFVLIGLPAMESGNGLIIPAAGHELGHLVWKQNDMGGKIKPLIDDHIETLIRNDRNAFREHFPDADLDSLLDQQGLKVTEESHSWCRLQCEEAFCDLVGLWLFGVSYLYVFLYLLAPNLGGLRSPLYPPVKTRARYLSHVARDLGLEVPEGFEESFEDETWPARGRRGYLLELADEACERLAPQLQTWCHDFMNGRRMRPPLAGEEQDRIIAAFAAGLPASDVREIGHAVNAAWEGLDRPEMLKTSDSEKEEMLNELLLKTFEIMEYELRVNRGTYAKRAADSLVSR